jgi:hypothetical protein
VGKAVYKATQAHQAAINKLTDIQRAVALLARREAAAAGGTSSAAANARATAAAVSPEMAALLQQQAAAAARRQQLKEAMMAAQDAKQRHEDRDHPDGKGTHVSARPCMCWPVMAKTYCVLHPSSPPPTPPHTHTRAPTYSQASLIVHNTTM